VPPKRQSGIADVHDGRLTGNAPAGPVATGERPALEALDVVTRNCSYQLVATASEGTYAISFSVIHGPATGMRRSGTVLVGPFHGATPRAPTSSRGGSFFAQNVSHRLPEAGVLPRFASWVPSATRRRKRFRSPTECRRHRCSGGASGGHDEETPPFDHRLLAPGTFLRRMPPTRSPSTDRCFRIGPAGARQSWSPKPPWFPRGTSVAPA